VSYERERRESPAEPAAPVVVARQAAPMRPAGVAPELPSSAADTGAQAARQRAADPLGPLGQSRAAGQPVPGEVRRELEPQLGADLGRARLHTDGAAAHAANAFAADAFTVGENVYFGAGRLSLADRAGRKLLAHELSHVAQAQQGRLGGAAAHSPAHVTEPDEPVEKEADAAASQFVGEPAHGEPVAAAGGLSAATVARAPAPAPAPVPLSETLRKGAPMGGGRAMFYPRGVSSTRVGALGVPGGLKGDTVQRLNVIIDAGTTLRGLATLLLPLWNGAGAAQPDPDFGTVVGEPLTVDELARGLAIYGEVMVPNLPMYKSDHKLRNWRAGYRLVLPVMIDATGEGVVNPKAVKSDAGLYPDDALGELDSPAPARATVAPADLQKQVEQFLVDQPTATGRGMALGYRVMTNAAEAQDLVIAVLGKLAGDEQLEAALYCTNYIGARVDVVASQPGGVAILNALRAILIPPPTGQPPNRQMMIDAAVRMLERGRAVEIELLVRDWPNALPHTRRLAGQQIGKKKDALELTFPAMPAVTLTAAQRGVVDKIKSARNALPAAQAGRLSVAPGLKHAGHPELDDSKSGYIYGGGGSSKITAALGGGSAAKQAALTAIMAELGGEGGWSAVNTYDDAIVTLGRGFTRQMLAKVMQSFFAKDPAAADQFLDVGVTWMGGKALVVNTDSGAVEEGDDALQLIRLDTRILDLFIRIAESPEHGAKLAQAQVGAIDALQVPDAVADTWPSASIKLAAHCIHWRGGKTWSSYVATAGNVAAIVHVVAPLAGSPNASVGGGILVPAVTAGILFKFAGGLAKTVVGAAGPAPADAATSPTRYRGHVFFEDGTGNFFHLP
jgi:hypothetical protein